MGDGITDIAGIEIPSTNPVFLTLVGIHVLLGLACVIAGAIAILSPKRRGRHPRNGTIYFWCLAGAVLIATGLATVRWAQDYHLFVLGALSFAAAYFGRRARQERWRHWVHITGMGSSYVLLPIAFYVDNGKSLPLWRELLPLHTGCCRQRSAFPSLSARCFGIRWYVSPPVDRTSAASQCIFRLFWKYELTDARGRETLLR